jgi:hypothetical protein
MGARLNDLVAKSPRRTDPFRRPLMWKRELDLRLDPCEPPPVIHVADNHASLSVLLNGCSVTLVEAERDADRLVRFESRDDLVDPVAKELAWDAPSTLALALALRGWPLVRSSDAWERSYFADAAAPESLAYKITLWEAWARKHGWRVSTPLIPGLAYPTWDDFEARWKRESEAVGL